MKVGIVGHEGAKFTPQTEKVAREIIDRLIHDPADVVVSGACHLGGVDVWAEEAADTRGVGKLIYPPKSHDWSNGYKPRNIEIATNSDVVHVLVVAELPASYAGMRFPVCYHCARDEARRLGRDHVKSGGCWTARYAQRLGKPAYWHII